MIPIEVKASLESGTLVLDFTDGRYTTIARAKYGYNTLSTPNGRVCGYIRWNPKKVTILVSTLLGNDPQPWGVMYVDPGACVPTAGNAMSSVTVNGEDSGRAAIEIYVDPDDDSIAWSTGTDGSSKIDLYDTTYVEDTPITKISINGIAINGPDESGIHNHVWLKSAAECDIRVITDDVITLTEVSNDRL
jgi:hypothetical protein